MVGTRKPAARSSGLFFRSSFRTSPRSGRDPESSFYHFGIACGDAGRLRCRWPRGGGLPFFARAKKGNRKKARPESRLKTPALLGKIGFARQLAGRENVRQDERAQRSRASFSRLGLEQGARSLRFSSSNARRRLRVPTSTTTNTSVTTGGNSECCAMY